MNQSEDEAKSIKRVLSAGKPKTGAKRGKTAAGAKRGKTAAGAKCAKTCNWCKITLGFGFTPVWNFPPN